MSAEACAACGSCCHHLVIRATREDLQREPRISLEAVPEFSKSTWRLAPREKDGRWGFACPFLRGCLCSIYETRPGACVSFQRGSPECAAARARDGKEPIDE